MATSSTTKKTGTFMGKSNKLGQGGRAAQLKAKGVPGSVIGAIARAKGAAPGQKNFHRKAKRAITPSEMGNEKENMKVSSPTGKKMQTSEVFRGKKSAKRAVKKRSIGTAIGNTVAKATGWPRGLNDMSLNKSGTVGTEPISKGNNKYTEVKAGGLGKVDVPMGTLNRKKRSVPQRKNHRSMSGAEMLDKACRK